MHYATRLAACGLDSMGYRKDPESRIVILPQVWARNGQFSLLDGALRDWLS
jgi:hypothetical protein